MPVITYGEYSFNTTDLPPVSIQYLLEHYTAHYLGNVQASKVTKWKESNATATEAEIAAQLHQFRVDAIQALKDGTVGTRASSGPRGPKLSPLDTLIRDIAAQGVIATLVQHKLMDEKVAGKLKLKDTITIGTGDGAQVLTFSDMIARRIVNPKYAGEIRAEAQRKLREQERAQAKIMEQAAQTPDLAEALGL